jgi:hypothetical protein
MRFNGVEDIREVEREYKYFIRINGYIPFDEFIKYEYRWSRRKIKREDFNSSNLFDFDSMNMLNEKSINNTNDSYEYRGFFDSVSIEPMSELDRQTWNRWTKGESLQEQWNKLR